MGTSDFRRLRAAERAVWHVGRAGAAAHSGRTLGPRAHFDQTGGGPYTCADLFLGRCSRARSGLPPP
eukprot:12372010-Alexandrium_andersonii.AAC.1